MSHMIDPAWFLLVPFLAILAFTVWALWNFSDELRTERRRRVRRSLYGYQVRIYQPEPPVLRFRRSHEKEAA